MREYVGWLDDEWNIVLDHNQPIVRCRDCRAIRVKYGNTGIECWMSGEPFTVEPDGFCKWGEPK